MTRNRLLAIGAAIGILVWPRAAAADATAFIGATLTTPSQSVRGVAVGMSLVVVGVEFEYAGVPEDQVQRLPSLRTGMFNVLLQTPVPIFGMQFYGTTGAGLYRETLLTESQTDLATNIGGGVKLKIFGPLRARFDYRILRLRGTPVHGNPQRVYAGINLAF